MPMVQTVDTGDGKDIDLGVLQIRPVSLCDQVTITHRSFNLHFLHPPKTYRVSGRVVDAGGAGVVNVIVTLSDACGGFEARTGPDGTFQVRRVGPYQYILRVKGAGFLPIEQSVSVGKQERNTDLGTIVVGTVPLKTVLR